MRRFDKLERLTVFLDGASASGKSTFKSRLMIDGRFHFVYARRHTSRSPRPGDDEHDDYIFVNHSTFEEMKRNGSFVEYRDFLFGMSYGVSREEIARCQAISDQVLALMNLGSVPVLRKTLPDATCVLIDAPFAAIEERLRSRGVHTEEQVSERLENARTARRLASEYDFVFENVQDALDRSYETLAQFLLSRYEASGHAHA